MTGIGWSTALRGEVRKTNSLDKEKFMKFQLVVKKPQWSVIWSDAEFRCVSIHLKHLFTEIWRSLMIHFVIHFLDALRWILCHSISRRLKEAIRLHFSNVCSVVCGNNEKEVLLLLARDSMTSFSLCGGTIWWLSGYCLNGWQRFDLCVCFS